MRCNGLPHCRESKRGHSSGAGEGYKRNICIYIYIYIVLEQILVFQTPPKPHHMRGAHGGRLKEERERELAARHSYGRGQVLSVNNKPPRTDDPKKAPPQKKNSLCTTFQVDFQLGLQLVYFFCAEPSKRATKGSQYAALMLLCGVLVRAGGKLSEGDLLKPELAP